MSIGRPSLFDRESFQGSPANQIIQIIRCVGYNDFDRIELATVTSPPPELKIKIDNVPIEFEADDLIVAEHLTKYPLEIEEDGIVRTISVNNELKPGDRVIVASRSHGYRYYVIDRAVSYLPEQQRPLAE
jgi:hypothetical protein